MPCTCESADAGDRLIADLEELLLDSNLSTSIRVLENFLSYIAVNL